MSHLIDRLLRRGLISGIYPESQEYRNKLYSMLKRPVTVYSGFDATASSLHVGNLATIINLLHFQRDGHQIVFVIGDATTQVGDPSGHTKDRLKIDQDIISSNANHLEEILRRLVGNFNTCFSGKNSLFDINSATTTNPVVREPIIIRNSVWYENKNVIDFVGDVFREVRVGGLLHKKSVQERLKTRDGLNLAEFSYQVFQAFDWMELMKRFDCRLQVGGADQGGNIYTGHDLIKKCLNDNDSIGLLAPLITSSKSGKKLGKSTEKSQSGIWLREELSSPFDLYQFFHRTADHDVEKFLRVFTFYDDEYIKDLVTNELKNPKDIWHCQRKLAEHACLLVYGEKGLSDAERVTDSLFAKNKKTT